MRLPACLLIWHGAWVLLLYRSAYLDDRQVAVHGCQWMTGVHTSPVALAAMASMPPVAISRRPLNPTALNRETMEEQRAATPMVGVHLHGDRTTA